MMDWPWWEGRSQTMGVSLWVGGWWVVGGGEGGGEEGERKV